MLAFQLVDRGVDFNMIAMQIHLFVDISSWFEARSIGDNTCRRSSEYGVTLRSKAMMCFTIWFLVMNKYINEKQSHWAESSLEVTPRIFSRQSPALSSFPLQILAHSAYRRVASLWLKLLTILVQRCFDCRDQRIKVMNQNARPVYGTLMLHCVPFWCFIIFIAAWTFETLRLSMIWTFQKAFRVPTQRLGFDAARPSVHQEEAAPRRYKQDQRTWVCNPAVGIVWVTHTQFCSLSKTISYQWMVMVWLGFIDVYFLSTLAC